MERRDDEQPLADGTGMDRPNDQPVMPPADELTDQDADAGGDEKTAVEGSAGIGATHASFGGSMPAWGGIGTHVPVDDDEHVNEDEPISGGEESADEGERTDPRGY